MKRERIVSGLLLLVGLGLAFLGQYYFAYRRDYRWDGVIFWCVAILLFVLLFRRKKRVRSRRSRAGWRLPPWVQEHPMRVLLAIGGLWLSVLAGVLARRWPGSADFTRLLLVWLAGTALFMAVFVPPLPPKAWPRLRSWLCRNWVELLGVVALLLVAFGVRAYDLEHIPINLGGDEGTWGLQGLEMLEGGRLANPFATRWFGFSSMSFLAWGLAMQLFGETVAGLRMLSVLIGTASVLTTFLLARELWGRKVAWLAAVVLTCGHFHLHFSRLAVNNIGDPLFVTLAFWLFLRGLRSERTICFVLAGAVVGVGIYGYVGARLIPIVIALYVGWRAVVERRFLQRHGQHLALLVLAVVVVTAPLLLYYLAYPDRLFGRYNQVNIFASGWLSNEQVITGRSAASLLLEQFWKSVSVFHYQLDPTFWYHADIPMLDSLSGVLIVLGMVWTIARWRWRGNGLLLLWFWLALATAWFVTENPPSSMRGVIITPAAAILVALGTDRLLRFARRLVGGPRLLWTGLLAVVLAVVAFFNLRYYFLVYTPSRVYGNPTAEISDVLADELDGWEHVPPVYFDGAPRMYWDFGAVAFRLRGVEGQDFSPEADLYSVTTDRGALFVVLGENASDLPQIHDAFPGGVEESFYSDADGRLLFTLYHVPEGRN